MRAALILLLGLTSCTYEADPVPPAVSFVPPTRPRPVLACDSVLTVADVAKACGSHPVIKTTIVEGKGDDRRHALCSRDIEFGGDFDRSIRFVLERTHPDSGARETIVAAMKRTPQARDIDGKAYFASYPTAERPSKQVWGSHGPWLYSLVAYNRPSKLWSCSEDGMVELGRLLATRIAASEWY